MRQPHASAAICSAHLHMVDSCLQSKIEEQRYLYTAADPCKLICANNDLQFIEARVEWRSRFNRCTGFRTRLKKRLVKTLVSHVLVNVVIFQHSTLLLRRWLQLSIIRENPFFGRSYPSSTKRSCLRKPTRCGDIIRHHEDEDEAHLHEDAAPSHCPTHVDLIHIVRPGHLQDHDIRNEVCNTHINVAPRSQQCTVVW